MTRSFLSGLLRSIGLTGGVFMLLVAPALSADVKQCFTPLKNEDSHNPADWKQLIEWRPDVKHEDILYRQDLKIHGKGDKINLDYYSITFDKLPDHSEEEFFHLMRLRLPSVIFHVSDAGELHPYPRAEIDKAKAAENEKLWKQKDPTGALMNFILTSIPYNLLVVQGKWYGLSVMQGDVIVTCSSPTDFIFSVANTKRTGLHPVSGNRGFGIRDNGKGKWTFYTMGADRLSPRWANLAPVDIYAKGDAVWRGMLANFAKIYVNLKPQSPPKINSCRYKYPECCQFSSGGGLILSEPECSPVP
jgi:hypothetical protein